MDKNKEISREQAEIVSPPSLRCHKCRYKGHGFICWGSDGSCMRTWVDKNINRKGSVIHEKSEHIPAK